ncbi:alpha-L-rhamnosidase [Croceivirga sp. JEA036]|uniref:alpha-L-rhamnosidase n=1 Tax=Croceivirga sp. JEA036 TaxID=2721162 RepID=UPI00143A35F3|nr:alpha-L-rhamnosidase [Croceivirga sp. JEA036]NJB35104.1 family 78 glycoside hydrolase catalytic domain [Croceivirga sp. JEA036]
MLLTFLVMMVLAGCESKEETNALSFVKVTTDHKENPLAIENKKPQFSWVVNVDGFNRSQTAYHILVATSEELLNESEADSWNSNKVESTSSTFVDYQGSALQPTQTYYWKVKIWDENGRPSDWSEVQQFTMGLMDESQWGNAKWITLNKDTRTSQYRFRDYKTGKMDKSTPVAGFAASYFRKEVDLQKDVENAEAYICGLGYYELYLNGEKVGDHVLDPAPSNYDKQAYYVKYDITDEVKSGENAFGIIMGNGFYGQNISWKNDPESERDLAYGPPTVKLMIKVTYADGSKENIVTDASWKESTGPIVFNNIYGGDTYDARYEINGWNTVGYDDASWGRPKEVTPVVGKLSAQQISPIKKLQEFEPQKVFKGADGEWIVDFGQNIAGWVKLNVSEKEGQLIEVTTTEALLTDGSDIFQGSTGGGANGMPQIYKYVCKGNDKESWEPKFSYHGFRYAKVKGVSKQPDAEMIKAVLVATDVEETGSFNSSEELFNKMHSISKWTIQDNLHGIPEDCPHREKCGWLGDAHAFAEYALYNYDMYDFYKKYMEDIRTQMRPTAGTNDPDIMFQVPTMIAPGKRTSTYAKIDWGVATMYLPWYNYVYYGDDAIIMEYYNEMKNLTDFYLNFKGENGIMQDGMGDWCPPLWDRRLNPSAMETDPIISANAYFYDVLGIMEKFAEMNGDSEYAAQMQLEKEALKKAFNAEYLKPITGTEHKWYLSQTATVQALQFGMVPEDELEKVVNGLAHDIVVVKGGHHSTGIHGNRYIYTVLAANGKADLAHEILTTPDFPSQTYVMNSGFTTWPERQFVWEEMEGPTNSLNHPMHSGFAAYFYESLGGIKSSKNNPGYKEFTVTPQFPTQIEHIDVSVPTPYGTIKNKWVNENGNVTMELEVPFNTTALFPFKDINKNSIQINNTSWKDYQDESLDKVKLGSGKYTITFKL